MILHYEVYSQKFSICSLCKFLKSCSLSVTDWQARWHNFSGNLCISKIIASLSAARFTGRVA